MAWKRSMSNAPPMIIIFFMLTTILSTVEAGKIGVNWGRRTSHRLLPSMVTDILLQNEIKYIRTFSVEVKAMMAFSGSGVIVTLSLPTASVPFMGLFGMSRYWLNDHVRSFKTMGIDVRYLQVGTDITLPNNSTSYNLTVTATRSIQSALEVNDHDYLHLTISHTIDILNPITKPSEADFNPIYKPLVIEYLSIMEGTNSPFSIVVMPFEFIIQNNLPLEFAFMDNKSNFSIIDNAHVYMNAFELIYDSFVVALSKAGHPDTNIVVAQIGWPTDGHPVANKVNAERFYKGLLPHIKSDKGTQRRPGASIEVYLHSLADENLLGVTSNKSYLRHWGIYKSNGEPKFKIDLSGEGRDVYPTVAKGTVTMPKRWCIFNGDKSNMTKVQQQFAFACKVADCTPLYPGGSCSFLSFDHNVSYAFNNVFQTNTQYNVDGTSCDFDGLGEVVPDNPSIGSCDFQLEILGADLRDLGGVNKISVSNEIKPSFYLMMIMSAAWVYFQYEEIDNLR